MSENNIIKIDVAGVLKARAPKTKVPKFVVNYLRRIVHEDEFNKFFRENPDLKNIAFIEAAFKFMDINLVIEGEENLPPKDGKYILVGNQRTNQIAVFSRNKKSGMLYDTGMMINLTAPVCIVEF